MKIMTKEMLKRFEKNGDTSELGTEDIIVQMKLFGGGACTWYCYEYNPEAETFYAFVNLGDPQMAELGLVSLKELEALKFPPFGLPIERDLHFKPQNLKEIIDTVQSGGHV